MGNICYYHEEEIMQLFPRYQVLAFSLETNYHLN